jgi:glycosyltransferase involved in cell wall biosynthesis
MRIRVLHIIDHLGYGGAPIVVKNIVENLNNQHIETYLCALRTNPDALPVGAKLISLTYHRYNPLAVLAIAKLCKKYKIDIVHAHLQKSIISSLFASFLTKSKIIIHEHGPILRGGTGFIYRLLLKILRCRAAIAIANSQATKIALSGTIGFAEISAPIVSNFIDFGRFNPAFYDRDKTRAALGIAEDKIAIGFMGRLHRCKGADLLVEAAAILCEKDQRFRFFIVGDGPERKHLEGLAARLGLKEKVVFTGLCKDPAEVIRAFDIAVIPSRREAFGITAIEFMQMLIPVVASPVGGLAELVQNEQTGILLDSLTAESIADAVNRLVHDSSLRERLTKAAEVFSRKFDGKEQLKQITDIYEKLCSQKKEKAE